MSNIDVSKKLFEAQDPDERIILVVRKHKLVLATSFIGAILISIIILVFYFLMTQTEIFATEQAQAIAVVIISLAFLYVLLFSFSAWLIKYLDILILTSKRLVVISQNGLFRRSISTLDLSTIQDVAVDQKGIFETFLNFGKVTVQTAGEMPNFVYKGVGKPCEIQDAVMDAKELYINHQNNISSNIIRDSQNP